MAYEWKSTDVQLVSSAKWKTTTHYFVHDKGQHKEYKTNFQLKQQNYLISQRKT